jgi:hypothetical protein
MGALPESVRRQVELSSQLSAKMKSGTLTFEDTQMTPSQVQMPANDRPPMPSGFQPQPPGPGAPGLGTSGFNPQPAATPEAQRAAAPQPAAAQPPQQQQAPAAPAATPDPAEEHRFKVLQGKYNAEVPRLHKEKAEALQRAAALEQQLAATQALLAGIAQPPAPTQVSRQESLVTDKEVQEYGADLIDVVRRAALEAVSPKLRTLEEQFRPVATAVQQMAPVVQHTQQESQKTAADLAHERMCDGLDAQVTDANGNSIWEQINAAPEFQAWLDQVDPYAGTKRGAMLAAAYQSHDLPRVAAFFTGFMKEHAAVAPQGQQQTSAPAGQTQPGTPAVSLASLAAPGTGVGGPVTAGAPNEPGQRVYTRSEIAAFYSDVNRGAYRGRDAEKQALEKDIFNAQKQGRIR